MSGWIGVDLDGTLAVYTGWRGIEHIGPPVPAMVERVKRWLEEGKEVRIFTARAYDPDPPMSLGEAKVHPAIPIIQDWLERECRLPRLKVTNVKDYGMIELWDDRAVQVEINTGLAYVHPRGRFTTP